MNLNNKWNTFLARVEYVLRTISAKQFVALVLADTFVWVSILACVVYWLR